MKRLKAPPAELAADRGTQVTTLKVLPAKRSASFGGPPAALVLEPAEPNAAASTTAQIPTLAGFDRVSIRIESFPCPPRAGTPSHLAEGAQHACRGSQ